MSDPTSVTMLFLSSVKPGANSVVSSHAIALLFVLLGRGSIGHAGAFFSLASGQAVPIPLP